MFRSTNFSQKYSKYSPRTHYTSKSTSPHSINSKNNSNNYNTNKPYTINKNINKNINKKIPLHIRELIVPNVSCPDCREYSKIIEDKRGGKIVCTNCGLILENQIISDEREWRVFANDNKSGPNPDRVGCAENYYLKDLNNFSTSIGSSGSLSLLNKTQNKYVDNNKNSKLTKGILSIQKYSSRLYLTKDIQNYSCELFKEVISKLYMRKQYFLNVVVSVVYIACKACNNNKSLRYLCDEFIVDIKKVKKILTTIDKLKASQKITVPIIKRGKGYIQRTTAEIYAINFGKQLGLNIDTLKGLKKISRKIASKHILMGKKPSTIAAVSIYVTCIVNGDESQHRCYKEISQIAKISEHTIKKAFREKLYCDIKTIIPDGYGDNNRIANKILLW